MFHKKIMVILLGGILLSGVFLLGNGTTAASATAVSDDQTVSVSFKVSAAMVAHSHRSCPPTLKEGSRGLWVAYVQMVMVNEGIRDWTGKLLLIDGKYGARTEYVVWVYQIIHGIRADGIVGPQTWRTIGVC